MATDTKSVSIADMLRAIDKWLPGYLRSVIRRPRCRSAPRHLMFCVVDHFEPFRAGAPRERALRIIDDWVIGLPRVMDGRRDADGQCPRHTFFYPQEDYDPECLDRLARLTAQGYAEVEIHLHHRNDSPDGLRAKLVEFRDVLSGRHRLLGRDQQGRASYGFIHGNWALCNSRPDGDWCGVNDELGILSETGCYADFTFPSAPSPTQPRMVNAIYYAADANGRPRGHDRGVKVRAGNGKREAGSGNLRLMLIQGPLALNWKRRKWGILPRIENATITGADPVTPARIDIWVNQQIHVDGMPEWVFVKVSAHGCVQENMAILLGESMRKAYNYLQLNYNDGKNWVLHYVAAREMYNITRAAEDGKRGNPGDFRDYEISRPPVKI